jgi:hypothetical protein
MNVYADLAPSGVGRGSNDQAGQVDAAAEERRRPVIRPGYGPPGPQHDLKALGEVLQKTLDALKDRQ